MSLMSWLFGLPTSNRLKEVEDRNKAACNHIGSLTLAKSGRWALVEFTKSLDRTAGSNKHVTK